MAFEARAVRLMISSPNDVTAERDLVESAIREWNGSHAEREGIVFIPWRWEADAVASLDADGQSVIDAQGVDQSDLVVALFWSRLGSPTAAAVSGTVAEIQRARAQGKPVHVFFSTAPIPRNHDAEQLARLREFEAELKGTGLVGEFDAHEGLNRQIQRALTRFAASREAARRADYFEANAVDRVYEELRTHWSFRPGAEPDFWDSSVTHTRRLVARSPDGLAHLTISLNRDGDASPQFSPARAPRYVVDPVASHRSSAGTISLRPPHKATGSSFAQMIDFLPPLRDGDVAHLEYRGELVAHKFAFREQVVAGSGSTRLGLRDWDYLSVAIGHPTALLQYSVFLPDELGAQPIGPQVDRDGVVATELTRNVLASGYEQERVEENGREGWLMRLTLREPAVKYSYRLRWRLPERP